MSFFNRKPSSLKCPRCGTANELQPCSNCGGTSFTRGLLSNNAMGTYCNACKLGVTHISCTQCGTQLPTETSWPAVASAPPAACISDLQKPRNLR
jgi:hypothetical protein